VFSVAPGQIFARDFRIERLLAEGGMGAVYIAEQLSTGQQRALKLMHAKLAPDAKSRERFMQEARIGSRIESEHIVQVVAAGIDDATDTPWLAMELLDGTDLDRLVQERGPLPLNEVIDLLEQMCHALGDAHEKGIIHRDLKPENLFLANTRRRGAERVLKVLDFGIAQITDLNRSGALVTSAIGSPLWMAPEQAMPGAKLKPATDVWAMGLITFFLLSGKSYWLSVHQDTFSLPSLLTEVLQLPLVRAQERAHAIGGAALPPGFDAWLEVALARDPDARWPNAREAYQALKRALTGMSATTPLYEQSIAAPAHASSPFVSTGPYGGPMPPPVSHTAPYTPPPIERAVAERSGGGLPLLAILGGVGAVLAAVGIAVVALVIAETDEDPAVEEEIPEWIQEPPADAVDYDGALARCESAMAALSITDAIAAADEALSARPGDVAATQCRARATALVEQGQIFDRGVEQQRRGEIQEAYFTFESLPEDSPFRDRPEVEQAAQSYVNEQLEEGQRLLATDPAATLRIARDVQLVRGISNAQRNAAQSLERAALATSGDRDEPRADPRPNPPREPDPPREEVPLDADAEARARQCVMQGDNACVIRTLEGRAQTERSLAMLIEAYRARSQTEQAQRHMRVYVNRYPNTPRARQYQQILARY
jgi:serine/threonine protein kinase